jgi:hypothetical protein
MSGSVVFLTDSKIQIKGIEGGLDLPQYQGDRPRTLRIVRERDGSVSIDPAKGYWLEREIDIPARQTVLKPVPDETTKEPVLDDNGQPLMEAEVMPIESVVVRTWAH